MFNFHCYQNKGEKSKGNGTSFTSVELTDAGQNSSGNGNSKEGPSQNNNVAEAPNEKTQDKRDNHPHYYNPNQGTCPSVTCVGAMYVKC